MGRTKFVLGLVPARGGSKGITNKNIRLLAGKPLIAHAIQCGLACDSISRLIVSTDSEEIARVAREWGAEVPFIRPARLAEDATPMLPVMQHAIREIEAQCDREVDVLVLIDPTAPMRIAEDIENALDVFGRNDCDAVVSGTRSRRSPYFNMVKENVHGWMELVDSTQVVGRRQDAPQTYDLNTVVWVYSRSALMAQGERIPEKTMLYEVAEDRALDIDTEYDLRVAECLMNWENG